MENLIFGTAFSCPFFNIFHVEITQKMNYYIRFSQQLSAHNQQ